MQTEASNLAVDMENIGGGYASPGWKRLQSQSAERPISQPRESTHMTIDAVAVSSFTTGVRVFHQKFGYGSVSETEGDKLTIAFEKAGVKKVVSRFVILADDVPF